jgi:hypothetical protein
VLCTIVSSCNSVIVWARVRDIADAGPVSPGRRHSRSLSYTNDLVVADMTTGVRVADKGTALVDGTVGARRSCRYGLKDDRAVVAEAELRTVGAADNSAVRAAAGATRAGAVAAADAGA